jgi:hypothetical protein
LRDVEKRVGELESEIQQHDAAMADFKSVEESMRLSELVSTRRKELAEKEAEWEEISSEMESPV